MTIGELIDKLVDLEFEHRIRKLPVLINEDTAIEDVTWDKERQILRISTRRVA